tara:strand:+ start:204 stop:500 length:297 start_codon:yes stop_codon:yes gene_type:complete
MRVKISYTVNIDEVEKEVSHRMTRAVNDLDFCYQELIRLQMDLDTKVGTLDNHTSLIDTIRIKMAKADQVLEDCSSILEGLEKARKQIEEEKNEIKDG